MQHNAHVNSYNYNCYLLSVLTKQQYNAVMQLNNATVVVHDTAVLGTWVLYVYNMYNDGNCTLFDNVHYAQCVHTNKRVYDDNFINLLHDYALCEQLAYTQQQLAHLHKLWDVIPQH